VRAVDERRRVPDPAGRQRRRRGRPEAQLLRAWGEAGEPPIEQVSFTLGDLGGPLSPEAEAAARAVQAGEICRAIGWAPEEIAEMVRGNFPGILQRVAEKRAEGRNPEPKPRGPRKRKGGRP